MHKTLTNYYYKSYFNIPEQTKELIKFINGVDRYFQKYGNHPKKYDFQGGNLMTLNNFLIEQKRKAFDKLIILKSKPI